MMSDGYAYHASKSGVGRHVGAAFSRLSRSLCVISAVLGWVAGASYCHAQAVPTTGVPSSWTRGNIAELLAKASLEAGLHRTNKNSLVGAEARRQEFLHLIYARTLGARSVDSRLGELQRLVFADNRLGSRARFEVTALYDFQLLTGSETKVSGVPYYLAAEEIARGLIADFPGEAAGYEALLFVALNFPGFSDAYRIGSGLAADPQAPAWVRVRAQTLISRLDLVGTMLPLELIGARVQGGQPVTFSPILIYSWSAAQPADKKWVGRLSALVPPGTRVLGVRLDDSSPALALNTEESVGAEAERGATTELSMRLLMDAPGLVYYADQGGIIRSVTLYQEGGLSQ